MNALKDMIFVCEKSNTASILREALTVRAKKTLTDIIALLDINLTMSL